MEEKEEKYNRYVSVLQHRGYTCKEEESQGLGFNKREERIGKSGGRLLKR